MQDVADDRHEIAQRLIEKAEKSIWVKVDIMPQKRRIGLVQH